MADPLRVPDQASDISPRWLTSALAENQPGIQVHSVEIVDVVKGACTKLRLALRTNRSDFPATVLMKAGFEPHSPQMRGMHVNEVHAYRDLLPTVEIESPRCFAALADDTGRALVILEDLCLRNVRFLEPQKPIDFNLAARFLDGLATLHARWWNSPRLRDGSFAWVPDASEASLAHYFELLLTPEHFQTFATAPRGAAMPRAILDPVRIRAAHAAMRIAQAKHEALVINHGDMHLGNLYVDAQGNPGFLDAQPRLGSWSIDVSYFLIAGLDLEDRRRWQAALLQHYLEALAVRGVAAPSFDDAWSAYRRSVIWGLLIWLLNGSNFQTEANNTAAASRFAMAMIDLDTFGILGV
ncbi:protein kinase family protein [Novosphingobium taihuense]|uniref:CHK kinase-like domain-containing protein n=1 Tax=Novosphingobium taihuense TaxID=260085 RepID=A0A7W7AFT6_9SPHN|nr:phosphotransferase [Novosphingobium taihuense]MBB4615450.1 hypothetical protein [Novosphingobium taihuense]TWH82102.1 ecdysteroid kinase [Novosphingobium taihuense]